MTTKIALHEALSGTIKLLSATQQGRFETACSQAMDLLESAAVSDFSESNARQLAALLAEMSYAAAVFAGMKEVSAVAESSLVADDNGLSTCLGPPSLGGQAVVALHDAFTGRFIRAATRDEAYESSKVAEREGGDGIIVADGVQCYAKWPQRYDAKEGI